jgi:hypothetical protein
MSSPRATINGPPGPIATDIETGDMMERNYWLFSRSVDLSVFLGSAILSLLLLWVGARVGALYDDSPDWAWVGAVLLVDVAHVHATWYRVYFDREEIKRRLVLYALVPILGYVLGVALYSEGAHTFWRALAYLAVFHFVRQQYGWVALYRAKLGEKGKLDLWIDTVAIYLATIYPLVHWHARLPRKFWWFVPNDFASLPSIIASILAPVYWTMMFAYIMRSLYGWLVKREGNPGKDIVVVTTAVCWYVGIVAFNSDYAFTVTNVIIHGVPYFALVYWYSKTRRETADKTYRALASGPVVFFLMLWALAYIEEFFWHRGVWHERQWLFGSDWDWTNVKTFLVPLLALPQLTHYVLDGFIWRRKSNPNFNLISTTQQK